MNNKGECPLCRKAELYHLSFIYCDDEYGTVPEGIAEHVKTCSYCQKKIAELKGLLDECPEAETSKAGHFTEDQLQYLELNLAFLDKEVRCSTIRPFLPKLLELEFKIGVLTPITTHFEHCESCRNDLAAIKSLALTGSQLKTLSMIFSHKSEGECESWSDASESIQSYVNLDFEAIEPSVLRHLCHCSVCQLLIYKLRAKRLKGMDKKQPGTSFCESVSFSNLFDYCFPYEMADDLNGETKSSEQFIKHLRQCPECLGKVQRLHEEVYAIKQRAESGIVTIYDLADTKEFISTSESGNTDDLQVGAETPCQSESAKSKYPRPMFFRKGLGYLTKGAVAAALIFAVVFILQSIPSAQASSLEQIYKAIQEASNVYIQRFSSESLNPIQEKLILKARGIYAVRDENGYSLLDLQKQTKTTVSINNPKSEEVALTEDEIIEWEQRKLNGALGLLPFEDISQLPPDPTWRQLTGKDLLSSEYIGPGYEVYELSWSAETLQGGKTDFKCHVIIESETNRPIKTEFYEQIAESGEFILIAVQKVRYLSDDSIEDCLKGFPR